MDFKKINITIGLVIFYIAVIIIFGLPYSNKKILMNKSYANAIKDAGFSETLTIIRKIVFKTGTLFAIMGCIMIFLEEYIIKNFEYGKNRKNITRIIWFTICIYVVITIIQLVFLIVSLVVMRQTQSLALKEFSRADFVWLTGITILSVYCLYSQIEWNRYLKSSKDE